MTCYKAACEALLTINKILGSIALFFVVLSFGMLVYICAALLLTTIFSW